MMDQRTLRVPIARAMMGAWVLVLFAAPALADIVPIDQNGYQNVLNLRQLALAMENYASANNTLPAQYLQSGGTPTLHPSYDQT